MGAGPAGLVLSHLLAREGIDSVVLEARSRAYVEHRVRAGVLEHGTVELLTETGVADRLHRESMVHEGLELRFDATAHRIPLAELTGGRTITMYGQQEVVKDLIAARFAHGGDILFDAEALAVEDATSAAPRVRFRRNGSEELLTCDVVAGCDGYWGVSRGAIPADVLRAHEHTYPYGWLGILAKVAPSTDELVYASHDRGFALHSMRSPELSRLYVQCDPDDDLEAWPDERVWDELHRRFELPGWSLAEGPVVEKSVTALRSVVAEPMQHGRLYLAGDAAHIVPATGAKGLNLAVADVSVLARALAEWYHHGDEGPLSRYSAECLRRVWRVQQFSWFMTTLLHRGPAEDTFGRRLQLAQLDYVASSTAAATSLAENYVGLPLRGPQHYLGAQGTVRTRREGGAQP